MYPLCFLRIIQSLCNITKLGHVAKVGTRVKFNYHPIQHKSHKISGTMRQVRSKSLMVVGEWKESLDDDEMSEESESRT
jgi:hypothetical protein